MTRSPWLCRMGGLALFGLAAMQTHPSRAALIGYEPMSQIIPSGLPADTAFNYAFGLVGSDSPTLTLADVTISTSPVATGISLDAVPDAGATFGPGIYGFALSGYFMISDLTAAQSVGITGTISGPGGHNVSVAQPIVFSTISITPITVTQPPITPLDPKIVLHLPPGITGLITVTLTDPLGHAINQTLTATTEGNLVVPVSNLLRGTYSVGFSAGGTKYLFQKQAVVTEPAGVLLFAPALLSLMMVRNTPRRRARQDRKARACPPPRSMPSAASTMS